ncbi:MAG: leucine-rich repeat domain-containing protein [Clostridia bacterium]|nr:leucine-rich repeat domain-containing protein [Clostridia bacterium]
MKRTFKKAIAVFLVVAMLLCAAPLNGVVGMGFSDCLRFYSKAAEESGIISGDCDNLTWSFDELTGELTINGSGKMPNWPNYSDVPWYSFKSAIKSVIIGDGVTSIGKYAFYYYDSLENVTIPDSVTSIEFGAFCYCKNLVNIAIPDSVTNIRDYAFSHCTNLESAKIGNGLKYIGYAAFEYCVSFSNIVIPDGVTYINQYAFSFCESLGIITIADSVTEIGYAAFVGCNDITDVYYMGSEKQWNKIKSGDFNNNLLGATIHYGHIHSMDTIEESAASTCTEKGYKKGTCICEYKYTEELPLLEHDIVIDKAVEATCTETGLTEGQHCSRCDNATIEQEVVPALNHKDTLIQVDAKAATCTESGWDTYEYCTACDYTTYVEKKALKHDIIIDEAVDSTCSETGLTQGQHCSRCDDMTIEQEVVPTKPHNHTAMYDSVKHWKECVCDSKIEEENHSFIDGNICSCGYERTIDVTIAIKNNNGSRTINYGETLELTAIVGDIANVPEKAVIVWYIDGIEKGEGETFRVKFESGTKTIEVKLVDENGVVYQDTTKSEISDSENITVKAGFFQKFISFFKNLFKISRIILQSI